MKNESHVQVLLNCQMDVKSIDVYKGRIFYIERSLSFENVIIRHEAGLADAKELNKAQTYLHPIKFISQAMLVKKQLLEQYRNLYYGHEDYYDAIERNIVKGFDDINADDVIPIICDHSAGELRDINDNPLEHMVRYNGYCYMVTSRDYKMKSLLKFLKSREDVIIHDEGMIPYYNLRDDESNVAYVNFFVRVSPEQFGYITSKDIFGPLPKEIIDIEQFKERIFK